MMARRTISILKIRHRQMHFFFTLWNFDSQTRFSIFRFLKEKKRLRRARMVFSFINSLFDYFFSGMLFPFINSLFAHFLFRGGKYALGRNYIFQFRMALPLSDGHSPTSEGPPLARRRNRGVVPTDTERRASSV